MMASPGALGDGDGGPGGGVPVVSFELPGVFEQVPSPWGGLEEAAEWQRYLDGALPSEQEAPGLPREQIKQQYTAMRRAEAAQGVLGSAVCCHEEDGQLTLAYLTVSVTQSGHDDPVVAAEGMYRAELDKASGTGGEDFAADGGRSVAGQFTSPGRLVLAVELPAGPAVTVITRNVVTAEPTEDYPEGLELAAGTIQVFIPASARYVAVLTLMTPTPGDLDEYAETMAKMASTVGFGEEFADQGG